MQNLQKLKKFSIAVVTLWSTVKAYTIVCFTQLYARMPAFSIAKVSSKGTILGFTLL